MPNVTEQVRTVARVVDGAEMLEGEGFLVHRPFPSRALPQFDPFLLLDEMGPKVYGPGEAKGAPDHPHRGFETVTYMLEGAFEHKDSHGHQGRIGPGDVQWMTAGSGVVHSEMPEKEFRARGGTLHGLQLWVNLPRADKMMTPRYQEVPSARIPSAQTAYGKVSVRVIAGEALGARAVIETRIPILFLHFILQPGAEITQPVPATENAFAYVLKGEGSFGSSGTRAGESRMVAFRRDGERVVAKNPAEAPLEFLLLAGKPLDEPVARYGPFVMNTIEEVQQAFEDYRAGRFGHIPAR
jgi:redox-sensitive bicupin YhaK (pirin superfamily)